MDAYDIFKKLTKGLKFKYPVLDFRNKGKHTKSEPTKIEPSNNVKEEQIEEEENLINPSEDESEHAGNNCDKNIENNSDENNSDENDDIQIVEGVRIGKKSRKKEKKEKPEELLKKLELEEQNHFRNIFGIKAVGRHIPAALKDFNELVTRYNIKQTLVDTVSHCKYTEPTPVQRQAIPCMLEDRQILACAPTGSGKTAAFLLPIIHALKSHEGGPRALILCPTRELAHQIYREALRLTASTDLRCSIIKTLKESKIKERESTFRKSDIVISTPNRLCYLLNQDRVNITLEKIHWLIIDEADNLFEGSPDQQSDFRQQIEQIITACESKQRRIAMFSATHTPAVAKWSRHNMRGLINVTVGCRNSATHLVDQELKFCGDEHGKLVAFRQLKQEGLKPPVLVFVQSKERAKQLFKELIYDGIYVEVIHSDKTQAQRDSVVRAFRLRRIWVLICTELMARGMDFHGVNLVINYDFPPTHISYIHRVGRAGRAGQRGRAITYFTLQDLGKLRSIASVLKQSGCSVPDYLLTLKKDNKLRKSKRVPQRENISTILAKPQKRKLEDEPALGADAGKREKHKKRRKLDNKENTSKVSKHKRNKKSNNKSNSSKKI